MRKENEKSLECRIGTTDTNNHILSIVGFWCSQFTGGPFCPRLQNRRYWEHSGEFWDMGEKHEKETDTMKRHCYSRDALYYLAIARCRWLVLNIRNKDSHLSKSNPEVGPKSSKEKKARKANLSKGGPKKAGKKEGDQLIKKFICEETYDTSHSQNFLSPRPLPPPKEKKPRSHVSTDEGHIVSTTRSLRACLHGGGGPQADEVTRLGGVTPLSI